MCKCTETVQAKRSGIPGALLAQDAPDEPLVRVQYLGGGGAKTSVFGRATRQSYGRRVQGETFFVYETDIAAQPGLFKVL